MRRGAFIVGGTVALAAIFGCDAGMAQRARVGASAAASIVAEPSVTRLEAPFVASFRGDRLLERVDARLSDWMEHTPQVGNHFACAMTCHTAMPAALAHGALSKDSPALARLRVAVAGRLNGTPSWAEAEPYYGAKGSERARSSLATEAVLDAASLAAIDRARGAHDRSAEARAAFDAMWSMQRADGGFDWLDFGLEPFEDGAPAIGAAIAARAVGLVGPLPGAESAHVEKLRAFLDERLASGDEPLFDRAFVVWSIGDVGGATPERRAAWLGATLDAQRADGAWSWHGLGIEGARGALDDADALPTAVAVLGLCRAPEERAIAARRRALTWLADHQAEDGALPSRSPNRDQALSHLLMSDAATGFSGLALAECAR
ncbi:MAG: hypothetical protein U0414_37245 [Polyangiaceae bacterium]